MNPCMVTTGFFVLERCGRTSVTACPQCRRPLCGAHQATDGRCPECVAASLERGRGERFDPYYDNWVPTYRRIYYEAASERYSDPSWYAAFDSYDRGAFEPGNEAWAGGDYDYEGDSGLVDS